MIRTPVLLFSLLILVAFAVSGPRDGGQGPNGIAPSSPSVVAGTSVSIQVSLSGTTTADQVVTLSSSSTSFAIPSSVTVPAGSSVAYTYGVAAPGASMSTVVVTASANGYSAQCNLGIVP